MRLKSRLMTIVLITTATLAFAQDWSKKPQHVTISPVAAVTVTAARPANAIIRFRVAPGFHINSSKPNSELLIPTVLTVSPLPQVKAGKVVYPAGHDFTLKAAPSEKLNVFSGDVSLNVPISAAKPLAPGSYTLKADLRYQACDDNSCYPPKTVSIEIPVTVLAARK